ncbi:MAG: bifunctional glutamate N-acetyltransferase/amino-acid acetyltransferase ArgJ [Actinomycetota bacterium]|nr:bifunctional glutamate N-acetyltransferase/amino-acid acetyltransferase ArgJ [Actinomycetota bacterium]
MSVTAAKGFSAAGVKAGLKASGNHDVALVLNEGPEFTAAGVFTSNRFKAAPVLWSLQVLAERELKAVVLNSGGANACTGPEGFADTHHTAEYVATVLASRGSEFGAGEIAVCSTGLIGERLPMDKICAGIDASVAELSATGGDNAALAIMTTDRVPKKSVMAGEDYVVGGMAKGAGMLAPGLATMLVVITTDAIVDADLADAALRQATAVSFDRIDSDGCMSTNDTVLLLASGASEVRPSEQEFTSVLTSVCADLALQLIHDAEGASKDIKIVVERAATVDDALEVGRAIARSNLLKCALHGEDPNWGRVLAAAGTTSAVFEPDQVDVAMNGVWICRGGGLGEDRSNVSLAAREIEITVVLRAGSADATVWTNDLTADYVHENSAYST